MLALLPVSSIKDVSFTGTDPRNLWISERNGQLSGDTPVMCFKQLLNKKNDEKEAKFLILKT